MSSVYDLYKTYKDKSIDDNFIFDAYDQMMKNEKDLKPYVKDFYVLNEDTSSYGSYHNEDRIIKINKTKLNNEDIKYKNLMALQVIKHEIEHARNLQRLEQARHDIETEVIFYSLRNYALENGLDNTNMDPLEKLLLIANTGLNYTTNPGERIADIKSWKYMVNLLKNQRGSDDLLLTRSMLYYAYVRGYKNNGYYLDCPTYSFLLETDQLKELKHLKKRVDYQDYTLDTRLLCGLPITYEEFDEDALKSVRLQKVRKK